MRKSKMYKFWKRMKEKGHGEKEITFGRSGNKITYPYDKNNSDIKVEVEPSRPMLVGDMIEYLTEVADFRGLWRSCEIHTRKKFKEGWSVTFQFQGKLVDVPYQKSAYKALEWAIGFIDSDPSSK